MSKKEFKEYLQKNGIEELFMELTEKIVIDKPQNIEQYLIEKLKKRMQQKKINRKVIFVLGGPGSGKGTQCSKLIELGGFCHFSAGDLLRKAAKEETERGKMIQGHLKNGTIVPGHITIKLLKEAIMGESEDKYFLIDGFPREMKQCLDFERDVTQCLFTMYFTCGEKELEKRIMERGKTSGRCDDNKEAIIKRFRTFKKTSLPVIEYLRANGKIREICGEKKIDEVFAETKKLFKK